MNTYRAKYKCRLCGAEFLDGDPISYTAALEHTTSIILEQNQMRQKSLFTTHPLPYNIHACINKNVSCIGVSEFVGFVEVK